MTLPYNNDFPHIPSLNWTDRFEEIIAYNRLHGKLSHMTPVEAILDAGITWTQDFITQEYKNMMPNTLSQIKLIVHELEIIGRDSYTEIMNDNEYNGPLYKLKGTGVDKFISKKLQFINDYLGDSRAEKYIYDNLRNFKDDGSCDEDPPIEASLWLQDGWKKGDDGRVYIDGIETIITKDISDDEIEYLEDEMNDWAKDNDVTLCNTREFIEFLQREAQK